MWVAHSTSGFPDFIDRFSSEAAFNILLPLSTFLILAFVRYQQLEACPDIDERVDRRDVDWEERICGFSLRHVHQLLNVGYLIVVTFTGTTTLLSLFAFALIRAKAGQPLPVSWQMFLAIGISLAFLFACGSRWCRQYRSVYLTFLTGTPAALCAALVWLSLFQSSPLRNIGAISMVLIGYIVYSVEVVLDERASGGGSVQSSSCIISRPWESLLFCPHC